MFLVAALLFSTWQHFELLRHGYQIEELQHQRAAEEETTRRLRLEIETLRSPKRIEALATTFYRRVDWEWMLNAGQTLHDVISVATADGTTRQISITINGANDAAVITGDKPTL